MRTARNRIAIVVLALVTVLALFGLPATAQQTEDATQPAPTVTATDAANAEDNVVEELPATGRGYGVHDTEEFAVQQIMVTLLVLVAAAALALGVIALANRYERH